MLETDWTHHICTSARACWKDKLWIQSTKPGAKLSSRDMGLYPFSVQHFQGEDLMQIQTQINKAFLNHDGDLPLLKSSLSLAKLNLMPPFNETTCYEDIKSLNNFVFYEVKL